MQKLKNLLCVAAAISLPVMITSCDDKKDPVKPKLSFSTTEMSVNEADGTFEVEVSLDKAYSKDITIDYTLKGTASDKISNPISYDYEILSDYGTVDIAAGETTGIIEIKLWSDFNLENDESIIIDLDDVDDENVEITRDDEMEITVHQEDGLFIYLDWPLPTSTLSADMDLILWIGPSLGELEPFRGSAAPSFQAPEFIFLPQVIAADVSAFGVSYPYFDGTLDPLNFTVTFAEFSNGDFEDDEDTEVFNGTYHLANINAWDDPANTAVVQTFTATEAGGFSSPTALDLPSDGSRIATAHEKHFKKFQESSDSAPVPDILKGFLELRSKGRK